MNSEIEAMAMAGYAEFVMFFDQLPPVCREISFRYFKASFEKKLENEKNRHLIEPGQETQPQPAVISQQVFHHPSSVNIADQAVEDENQSKLTNCVETELETAEILANMAGQNLEGVEENVQMEADTLPLSPEEIKTPQNEPPVDVSLGLPEPEPQVSTTENVEKRVAKRPFRAVLRRPAKKKPVDNMSPSESNSESDVDGESDIGPNYHCELSPGSSSSRSNQHPGPVISVDAACYFEKNFRKNPYPDGGRLALLAQHFGLTKRQVTNWFASRRRSLKITREMPLGEVARLAQKRPPRFYVESNEAASSGEEETKKETQAVMIEEPEKQSDERKEIEIPAEKAKIFPIEKKTEENSVKQKSGGRLTRNSTRRRHGFIGNRAVFTLHERETLKREFNATSQPWDRNDFKRIADDLETNEKRVEHWYIRHQSAVRQGNRQKKAAEISEMSESVAVENEKSAQFQPFSLVLPQQNDLRSD